MSVLFLFNFYYVFFLFLYLPPSFSSSLYPSPSLPPSTHPSIPLSPLSLSFSSFLISNKGGGDLFILNPEDIREEVKRTCQDRLT